MSPESVSKHISRLFDSDLEKVKTKLMLMGGSVEQQFMKITQGIKESDLTTLDQAKKMTDDIGELEIDIDSDCTEILAIRHPTAVDLRFVIAISRVSGILENISRHLRNVANYSGKIIKYGDSSESMDNIHHVQDMISQMIRDSLISFDHFDTDTAIKVIKKDEMLLSEYKNNMRLLVSFMMEDPSSIPRTLNLFWILHSLYRVGEYTREIAGYVIFVVMGNDIRHLSFKKVNKMLGLDNK